MQCDFCAEMQSDKNTYFFSTYGSVLQNRIIYETENFFVYPTIGQIVEGYLLILPKEHYLSIGQMPKKFITEVEQIKNFLYKQVSKMYMPPIFFEHGSVKEAGGCGVYHAHIHVVPCNVSKEIIEVISKSYVLHQIKTMYELSQYIKQDKPYLYFEDNKKTRYVFEIDEIPSQYIRRIFAELIFAKEWDWKTFKFSNDGLFNTYSKLKGIQKMSLTV